MTWNTLLKNVKLQLLKELGHWWWGWGGGCSVKCIVVCWGAGGVECEIYCSVLGWGGV